MHRACARLAAGRPVCFASNARCSRARQPSGTPAAALAGPLGRDQSAQQRGHRRPLVGEDPHVALRAGQGERPGQRGHRSRLLAAGRERQRPQRAGLDEAAGPVLGGRRRVQPVQQRKRPAGPALGEQHPGQHEMPRLAGVIRLIVRG